MSCVAGCRIVPIRLLARAALCLLALLSPAPTAAQPFERLAILAPASAGGGWDQTARAMQEALTSSGLARDVRVANSPGAGGAIGLAQFVNSERGNGQAMLVGGLVMVTAIRSHRATVSLSQTTPIARLTGDHEVIAVPAGSDVRDFGDLVQALRVNPGSVSWGGGSGGGVDQLLLEELAQAIGVEPVRMNYVAFSGGGEVAAELLSNRLAVGISGYGELGPHIKAGRLRALAISSAERIDGIDIPTLKEQGVPVTLVNWRGVFAPPALSDEQRDRLQALVDAMVKTSVWSEAVRRHGWTNLYLPADDFVHFLIEEETRVAQAPDARRSQPGWQAGAVWNSGMWFLRNRTRLGVVAALLALLAVSLLAWQHRTGARRERELAQRLEEAEAQYRQRSAETQDLLRGLADQIDRQFETWGLTQAEREVAMLMLKGLRHKEIATTRGTSERTVRQQALTVYKKAGLDGRTDLAAFFLEDLLQPAQPGDRRSA